MWRDGLLVVPSAIFRPAALVLMYFAPGPGPKRGDFLSAQKSWESDMLAAGEVLPIIYGRCRALLVQSAG